MSRQINVGGVPIGGGAPVSIQSMTNTPTHDVEATLAQIRAPGEGGSHACTGNNHLDSAVLGFAGKRLNLSRSAMGGESVHFKRNLHRVQKLGRLLHDLEVGERTHYYTYEWFHL